MSDEGSSDDPNGARSILRVPSVLTAVASRREGSSFKELQNELELPKSSLHRLLRTLENAQFLTHQARRYFLGPAAIKLASAIEQRMPSADFPACARPFMESLARETQESVILSTLSESMDATIYLDVIASEAPLRFTPPPDNRPPLYSVAAGKVILAFMPEEFQLAYLNQTEFLPITQHTTGRAALAEVLKKVRNDAIGVDCQGNVLGASAVASPVFGRTGEIICAVSAAGPAHRIAAALDQLQVSVREAAIGISRTLRYEGPYPPIWIGKEFQ